jgi:hypothetical protein
MSLGSAGEGTQTSRFVVANCEDGCNIRADVAETPGTITPARAIHCSAANESCAFPDDLSEVTITVKGGLVVDVGWGGLAIERGIVGGLVVVEKLSDYGSHIVSWAAGSNVLAISSTISSTVRVSEYSRLKRVGDICRRWQREGELETVVGVERGRQGTYVLWA